MGTLTELLTEYRTLSLLSKLIFWLSIGGISLAGFASWIVSLTKLGRARRIEDGLRAEIQDLQRRSARRAHEMHELREQKRVLEPEGRIEAIDDALATGDFRRYVKLIEELPKAVERNSAILTKLARYYSSLIFSMDPVHFKYALNYAIAAHHLDKNMVEAQWFAFELSKVEPIFETIVDDSLSASWPAKDSSPALFIVSADKIASKLISLSFNWIALSLVERAFHIAKNTKDLPDNVMCFAARGLCLALEAAQDFKNLEICAREELIRLDQIDPKSQIYSHWLVMQRHLSTSLVFRGQSDQALEILENIVPKMSEYLGAGHVSTLVARQMKSNALTKMGSPDVNECRAIARSFEKSLGPAASHTIVAQQHLANALHKSGKQKVATRILRSLDRRHRRRLGEHHQLIRQIDQLMEDFQKPSLK